MSDQPLVSILTPVYNGGPFLAETIESVLCQPYDQWEYVIVDNCSTDDTLAVAERYARKDSRIRVVRSETFADCESNHTVRSGSSAPRASTAKSFPRTTGCFRELLRAL